MRAWHLPSTLRWHKVVLTTLVDTLLQIRIPSMLSTSNTPELSKTHPNASCSSWGLSKNICSWLYENAWMNGKWILSLLIWIWPLKHSFYGDFPWSLRILFMNSFSEQKPSRYTSPPQKENYMYYKKRKYSKWEVVQKSIYFYDLFFDSLIKYKDSWMKRSRFKVVGTFIPLFHKNGIYKL